MNDVLFYSLFAAVAAFVIAAAVCPFFIPFLHRIKFGQNVREDGPQTHLKKAGTPTMGGIVIIGAFVFAVLAIGVIYMFSAGLIINDLYELFAVLAVTLCFGLVGFADDYIKVVKKRSLGLTASRKMAVQLVITAAFANYIYFYNDPFKWSEMTVPFTGKIINLGVFYLPFVFIVVIGCVNGSNFTDGLDGMNSGVTAAISAFLLAAAVAAGSALGVAAGAMIGGLLGFLIFNSYPAKVIMGDTGSLALGGFVAATALLLGAPLFLPVVALIYVAQSLSVMIQVGYFKLTKGKRVFKMAPLHHHFELSGFEETKVMAAFVIISILMCLIGVAGLSGIRGA